MAAFLYALQINEKRTHKGLCIKQLMLRLRCSCLQTNLQHVQLLASFLRCCQPFALGNLLYSQRRGCTRRLKSHTVTNCDACHSAREATAAGSQSSPRYRWRGRSAALAGARLFFSPGWKRSAGAARAAALRLVVFSLDTPYQWDILWCERGSPHHFPLLVAWLDMSRSGAGGPLPFPSLRAWG